MGSSDSARAIISSHNGPLMISMLAAAVPIRAHGYSFLPLDEILDGKRLGFIAQEIAEKGDVLQFGGPKGEPARLANLLAEGIARAAFAPGGIKTFGMHFEYQPGLWHQGKHGVPVKDASTDMAGFVAAVRRSIVPRTRKTKGRIGKRQGN